MSTIRTLALGSLMVLGVAGVSAAQSPTAPKARTDSGYHRRGARPDGQFRKGPGGGREGRGFGRDLNLTDAQKAQVKTIREKYLPQQLELRKAVQATGGPPDEATRTKMMDLQTKQADEIRAILNPDQQKTFDHNLHEMKERMDARRNGSS